MSDVVEVVSEAVPAAIEVAVVASEWRAPVLLISGVVVTTVALAAAGGWIGYNWWKGRKNNNNVNKE